MQDVPCFAVPKTESVLSLMMRCRLSFIQLTLNDSPTLFET